LQPTKLLIVGNDVRYTTLLLKHVLVSECYSSSEEDFLHNEIDEFDLIFFDSKIYNQTTIRHGKFMLKNSGRLIFFMHFSDLNFFDFSRRTSFIDIDVIERTYNNVDSKLFSTNLFLREK
jgi:hypothetical protein